MPLLFSATAFFAPAFSCRFFLCRFFLLPLLSLSLLSLPLLSLVTSFFVASFFVDVFFVAAFSYHCSFFQVGILLAWHSLGASVGALIGGSLFDVHGNYQFSLMLCAGKVKRDGYFNLFKS